jgi:uncharacterized membrane protein YecN with MAPEG domain
VSVAITGLYAGLLTLLYVFLALSVGRLRLKTGTSILHGNHMALATAIRRHANFAENVPLALILLSIIEVGGASPLVLHALGSALLIARVLHPLGLFHDRPHPLRAVGAFGTIIVLLIAGGVAVWQFLQR